MTLKFTFFYSDSNKDYFLGLLQKIAQNFGVKCGAKFGDEVLEFYASGEDLGDFASALTNEIPLSLHFRFKSVEVCEMPKDLKPLQIAESTENILSVSEINARNFLQDSALQDSALKDRLQNLCDLLQKGQEITLNTSKGKIALFTQKGDSHDSQKKDSHDNDSRQNNFDFILANDISTLNLYTRASGDEINALATFEKPLVNLNIKEVFISEIGAKNALFILPYDINLRFIFSLLEVPFLFAKRADSADNFFEIIVGKNGVFIENNILKTQNFDDFLDANFADSHDSQDILITYISTANPTLIAPFSTKTPFVKIAFDKNPKNILAKIADLENGDKLIANFAREFGERFEAIQSLDSTPQISENITDIFECAGMILGANLNADSHSRESNSIISPKQSILAFANDCIRDIGPKIDFENIKRENALFYDEIRTIRSIISFTLAGTEREMVAFGLLESLIDYLVLIFRGAQDKNQVKNVGIIGDMFANRIFFDKITKKIPADFHLILPKFLDYSEGQIARHTNEI